METSETQIKLFSYLSVINRYNQDQFWVSKAKLEAKNHLRMLE